MCPSSSSRGSWVFGQLNTTITPQMKFPSHSKFMRQLEGSLYRPFNSYLSGYALLLLFSLLLYSAAFTIFTLGSLRSGKIIHKKLVDSVLGTTLRFDFCDVRIDVD